MGFLWFCHVWGGRQTSKNHLVAKRRRDSRHRYQIHPNGSTIDKRESKIDPKIVSEIIFKWYCCWVVFVYPKRSQNGPKMVPKWHQIGHRGLSWRLLGSSWALPGACWRPSRPKECPKGPQEAPKGIPETILELIRGYILKPCSNEITKSTKLFKKISRGCRPEPRYLIN